LGRAGWQLQCASRSWPDRGGSIIGTARDACCGRLLGIDTLTVASLNLHCGYGSLGQPFDVVAALGELEAEVICVQEAWTPASGETVAAGGSSGQAAAAEDCHGRQIASRMELQALADAARKLGAELHRVAMCTKPSGARAGLPPGSVPGELSIAMLTTLPVIGYEVIELGRAPGDSLARFAQVALLELAGGTSVRVANTHLTHMLTSPLQLRELQRRLRADRAGSRPVSTIIAGDLNMPRLVAARSPGYAAAVRGRTWPAGRPVVQLDHLLASSDIERIEGAVLPPGGSDHLPVRARLRCRPPPP